MSLIELEPGLSIDTVFAYSEICSGSQIGHFGELRRNSGVDYIGMIFFDDWDKNCNEVGSLGVACVECRKALYNEPNGPLVSSKTCFQRPPRGPSSIGVLRNRSRV